MVEGKNVYSNGSGSATKKKLELQLTGMRFRHRMLCGILKSSFSNAVVAAAGVVIVFIFFSMVFGQQ